MEWKMIFVVTAIICGVIGIILYVHAYCNGNKKESVIGIAAFVVSILLGLASFVDKPAPFSLEVAQKLADERLTEEVAIQKTTIEELHKRLAEKDLPEYMQVVKELFDKGEYAKAIARLDAYKKEKDAEFYIFTAQLYIANYQFKEAGEHYRKAVEIFPSYDNTFAAARFYQDLNRFNEAKEYYERCLEMELSPAQRASVQNNLGNIFQQSNDYPEAEKAYVEALEIKRTLADEDPQTYKPDLAMTLNNLGALHSKKGEYEQAATYYKEALEINRELAKKDPDTYNPDLAWTLNNLGNLHYNLKDYDQAKGYHKEALQLRRGLAAKDAKTYNPDLATSLNNLGAVYDNMKRYEEAEECYTEALDIYRELAGTNPQAYNPNVAMALNNLGNLYANKTEPDYAKAEVYYKECLEKCRSLAAEHPQAWNPDVADTLANMAVFYQYKVPNKELSIRHAEEAIEILDRCSDTPYVNAARGRANAVLEEWEDR